MSWDNDLLLEQKRAASHAGSHARLLAGPGTGKTLTLTRHISYLVREMRIATDSILAFTFTRAAALELKQRVANELGEQSSPRISTLHSFALRQLIKNEPILNNLPQPLRIADDWEERNIVLEDIRGLLNLEKIKYARELLLQLSADWQSLTAEEVDWDKRFPNPKFLGVWEEHRNIYGYTLRTELVYQLKKALEQRDDFELESPIEYLLVDEYQDLNRCELAVVQYIESRNVELFCAGDDDQSIYGFRKAHPQGIRRIPEDYDQVTDLKLQICMRCDEDILAFGLFVAQQDPRRLDKPIETRPGAEKGTVAILRFGDQNAETSGITKLCDHLTRNVGINPGEILILLRTDRHGSFSKPLRESLINAGIPVAEAQETTSLFDTESGRALLAFMRLSANPRDGLAWRALLQHWCKGIGKKAINAIYEVARKGGKTFAAVCLDTVKNPNNLPSRFQQRVGKAIKQIIGRLAKLFPEETNAPIESTAQLLQLVEPVIDALIPDDTERARILDRLITLAEESDAKSLDQLIRALGALSEGIEQDRVEEKVNILTMHRAKGLTAEAVIIAATEDEYIPGRAMGEEIDDERRLLYVSLTRAKHHLFITYCNRRTGRQKFSGSSEGTTVRSLSRFLSGGPHIPKDGPAHLKTLRS